jgi:hypothetical protein
MAFRTWAKLLSATLGVGALAGASQLGLAYGLGIVRLTRVLDVTTRDQWTAQLAWVVWFPMVAAVVGALAGAMLLPRWSPGAPRPGLGTELALAFSAAIGAGVVVPLTMQPARTAQVAGVDPVVVIAICAGLGALVGVFAAWAALAQPVARWSLATMGVAVWTVALVSVAPSLAPSDPLPAVRLGVFDAGFLSPGVTQRTALATMPALALLIGAALGWIARRRELPTLTIALAGLPGPALLTIAYLIAGPGSGDDRYQVVPYWAAMTATGAGVLGSVLAAVLRRGPGPDDDDLPDDRSALPKRTGKPESAIAAAGAPPVSPAGPSASPTGDLSSPAPAAPRSADTSVFDTPPSASPTAPPPASPSLAGPPSAGLGGPPSAGLGGPPSAGLGGPSSAGLGGGLGEPPPAGLGGLLGKPRRRGRRSSMADAFIGRTGEFPAARPGGRGVAVGDPSASEPPFARGPSNPPRQDSPRSAGAPWSPTADSERPGSPIPGSHVPGGLAPGGPAMGGPAMGGPAMGGPAMGRRAAAATPYVPEPATRPLPPGAEQPPGAQQPPGAEQPAGAQQPAPRTAGGRLGRSLRPFARGRAAEPPAPEPTTISAPLPRPDPITPPPPPKEKPADETPDGKRKTKRPKDDDYVDWVSGLGK